MPGQQFAFGPFLLDRERHVLLRDGEPVAVGYRGVLLLSALVQRPGEVVTKAELMDAGWPGTMVEESNLSVQVAMLRKALGKSSEGGGWIATVPRVGYRFLGRLDPVERADHRHSEIDKGLPPPGSHTLSDKQSIAALPFTNMSGEALRRDVSQSGAAIAGQGALPDKPSIAILPFANLSGDPEQEYFADGIVEEIITALSRMRWLFVVARNSSFTYKGRAVDVKQVGRELGVRYVLEGSVRKSASRVRITGQLIDTSSGLHLWADRFDGSIEDIFDLQDQLTADVVGAIAPKLEQAEIERAKHKPTENLDAYDYYLRGLACVHRWTREANKEALSHFYRAIKLDPDFGTAFGMAARCYSQRKTCGWVTDEGLETAETRRLVRQAVEHGWDDALALCTAGVSLSYVVGKSGEGAALIERALMLNPNLALAWLFRAWVKVWLGESEAAIADASQAMRLSPGDPQAFRMHTAIASAHFFAGRYREALAWAGTALRFKPDDALGTTVAAASSALLGELDQAHTAMAHLRKIDPALRISNLRGQFPIDRPEHLARWAEGLSKAGLPD